MRNLINSRFALRRRFCLITGCAWLLLGMPVTGLAQVSEENLRLPISLDADSTDYDGKNSMLTFRGLRLTQGNIGVDADEGRATKLDFENSDWHFSGNVVIDTENGLIECDTADLHFSNHQLQTATISGSPATFEMQRPESEDITYAQAGRVKYNFTDGIVEFSDDATITEGGNQISSNYLVYNITEQRISAQSAGTDGERVKMTYTPRSEDPSDAATSAPAENSASPAGETGEAQTNEPAEVASPTEDAPAPLGQEDDAS